jgi:hypothetical protein
VDPEIKTLLAALVEGQVKLAEGQGRTGAAVVRLAEGQARTDAAVARLAEGQARTDAAVVRLAEGLEQTNAAVHETNAVVRELAAAQLRTEEKLGTLTDRVDRLAQLMIRGHTEAAERHGVVMDRLDGLDGNR